MIAEEASSSDTGRTERHPLWVQGTLLTLWGKGRHPTLGSTPSVLSSFASLTALCSSGIHTPYVSTQSCDADCVNGFLS